MDYPRNIHSLYDDEMLKKNNNNNESFDHFQELEPGVGEALCKLWDKVPTYVSKVSFYGHSKSTNENNAGSDVHKNVPDSALHFSTYRQQHQYPGRPIRGFQHPPPPPPPSSTSAAATAAVSGVSFHNLGRHNVAVPPPPGTSLSTTWSHKYSSHNHLK